MNERKKTIISENISKFSINFEKLWDNFEGNFKNSDKNIEIFE